MMAKKYRRIVSIALVMVLGMIGNPVTASAAELENMVVTEYAGEILDTTEEGVYIGLYDIELNGNGRAVMLEKCAIRMNYQSDHLYMEFVTGSSIDATEIGVKNVEVQHKTGIIWTTWETVGTSSGGCSTNTGIFVGTTRCYNVVQGETYRVKCTHYAYMNGQYYSLDNVTDGHKFV